MANLLGLVLFQDFAARSSGVSGIFYARRNRNTQTFKGNCNFHSTSAPFRKVLGIPYPF